MTVLVSSLLLVIICLLHHVQAWVPGAPTVTFPARERHSLTTHHPLFMSTTEESEQQATTDTTDADESSKDEEEWEYEEMDELTEVDFIGSEWLVGTNWDADSSKIKETWVRLLVDERGQNVAVWGDEKKEGKWSLDVASQFFCIYKESWGGWLGKKIWAGTIEDYYYLQGTIRGWSPISPASVLGQWQAKRLGVDPNEAGTPPWFEEDYEKEQEDVAKRNKQKQLELQEDEGIFAGFNKKEEEEATTEAEGETKEE